MWPECSHNKCSDPSSGGTFKPHFVIAPGHYSPQQLQFTFWQIKTGWACIFKETDWKHSRHSFHTCTHKPHAPKTSRRERSSVCYKRLIWPGLWRKTVERHQRWFPSRSPTESLWFLSCLIWRSWSWAWAGLKRASHCRRKTEGALKITACKPVSNKSTVSNQLWVADRNVPFKGVKTAVDLVSACSLSQFPGYSCLLPSVLNWHLAGMSTKYAFKI